MNSSENNLIYGDRKRLMPFYIRLIVGFMISSTAILYGWRLARFVGRWLGSTILVDLLNLDYRWEPLWIWVFPALVVMIFILPFCHYLMTEFVWPSCDQFGHKWNGCSCERTRCEAFQHHWDGCKCRTCGGISGDELKHQWEGCQCRTCGRIDESKHLREGADCRCVICGQIPKDETGHLLVNCQCTRCGKEFAHRWPTYFGSVGTAVKCQRPTCDVMGRITNISMNGSKRNATISFQDISLQEPNDASYIHGLDLAQDAESIYRYNSAPVARKNFSKASKEVAIRDLRKALKSNDRRIAHVAAFVLNEDYSDFWTELDQEELQNLDALLAEMGKTRKPAKSNSGDNA